jgi:hypothetical protein
MNNWFKFSRFTRNSIFGLFCIIVTALYWNSQQEADKHKVEKNQSVQAKESQTHNEDRKPANKSNDGEKNTGINAVAANNTAVNDNKIDQENVFEKSVAGKNPNLENRPEHQGLRDFLKSQDPAGDWSVESHQGNIFQISGGFIKGDFRDVQSTLPTVQALIEKMGVDPSQLQISDLKVPNTSLSKAYTYQQQIDGYSVYGSYMKVFVAQESGDIFHVTNSIYPLTAVDTGQKLSAQEASKIILKNYPGAKIISQDASPVLLPDQKGGASLVYFFTLEKDGRASGSSTVAISTSTGKVLLDESNIVY